MCREKYYKDFGFRNVMIGRILRWILLDLLFELFEALVPKKVRKIIGIILLSIGVLGLSFAWFESQGLDQNDPWSGFGVMFIGIFSLFPFLLGAVILIQTIEPPHIVDIEKEEENGPHTPSPSEDDFLEYMDIISENNKQQISCPPCGQKLNIPASYTGDVSCPVCKGIISIEKGTILL
tara:strand:+ start:54 stop:590 length:537 start_codon:yes stop_codon:yes gene_type:complete